jgi:hypothetical protein
MRLHSSFPLFLIALAFVADQSSLVEAKAPGKGPKKAPAPTVNSMVDGESGQSSPIKPVLKVEPQEMARRFFKEALSPYGDWLDLGEYGRCWKPKGVDEKWIPYTVGSWAYSRFGWTWVSSEPFGGIVFHFGRWVRAKEEGWCWMPDLEWAASWVSWRYGSETIGWAPLPPKAKWNPSIGIAPWADREYNIGPDNYVFCSIKDFAEPDMSTVLTDASENGGCILHSVNITNISELGKSIFAGGPAYNWVEARVRGDLPVIRVLKERSLVKFREQLREAADGPAVFKDIIAGQTVTMVSPDWGLLTDPRRADALGFTGEVEEKKVVKTRWIEGNTPPPAEPVAEEPPPRQVEVLTGWEPLREEERQLLLAKIAKESAGMMPGSHPAESFQAKRDMPGGQ